MKLQHGGFVFFGGGCDYPNTGLLVMFRVLCSCDVVVVIICVGIPWLFFVTVILVFVMKMWL